MLWTQLKQAITPQGWTMEGDAVIRQWLKDKGALPASDNSKEVAVKIADGIILRTEAEIDTWLRWTHECRDVRIDPSLPVATSLPAKRGKKKNLHNVPPRVEFFNTAGGATLTSLQVRQWEDKPRVGIRIVGIGEARVDVELAYIGAKVRARNAIRSMLAEGATTPLAPAYRYLSRTRLTFAENGIADPLNELHQSVILARPGQKKGPPTVEVMRFTVVGLEPKRGSAAGPQDELLHACLLGEDGKPLAHAVLRIDVIQPSSTWVGAFRVFNCDTDLKFLDADPEFAAIYDVAPGKAAEVRVGVADSGLFDDATGRNYLASHWQAGRYFCPPHIGMTADTRAVQADRPIKPEAPHTTHMVTDNPSKHGTNVGANAAWGSPKIKLVDVMVQAGQMTGGMSDAAAARGLQWGIDQGAAIINCSKLLPFQKDETHRVVSGAKDRVLFLATAGNKPFSFPISGATKIKKENFNGDGELTDLPRSFENTLWGGGCNQKRTPHESRGFGPAVDVMVPSDKLNLYTPLALVQAYRAISMHNFRKDLISQLGGKVVSYPERQELKIVERMRLKRLLEQEADGSIKPEDNPELLRLQQAAANTGVHPVRQRFVAVKQQVEALPTADMKVWMDQLLQLRDGLTGPHDPDVKRCINERATAMDANPAYEELKNAATANGIAQDDGVSFGLPLVANIAAKLKLIRSDLTPNKLRRMIVDTSDLDPGFENQCIARGIANPLRAYFAAYDNVVCAGGRDPRDYTLQLNDAIDERRRIYYTLFYMGADGLRLYQSIKDRLHSAYADVNIDLVEAEPPIRIPSEPITYVAGPTIHRHNWTSVVPVGKHPLLYDKKHLRLMLFNECAMVLGDKFNNKGEVHEMTLTPAPGGLAVPPLVWVETVKPSHTVQISEMRTDGDCFKCTLRLAADRPRIFPKRVDHVIRAAKINISEVTAANLTIERRSDHEAAVTLRFDNPPVEGTILFLDLGVLQPIGGNRDNDENRNISITTRYHDGASGSPKADASMLVLLLHEIGHALGMASSTQSLYYDATYGGLGDHCSHNAQRIPHANLAPYNVIADGTSGEVMVPLSLINGRGDPPCVMYHTRTRVHHTSVFCDECKASLRGDELVPKWTFNGK